MYYCRKCLNPSSRPGSLFIKGICQPCQFHAQQQNPHVLDTEKISKFKKYILEKTATHEFTDLYFSLGVSGGKDSLRQALFCREILKIEPTLVSVGYPPSQVTGEGISNLRNLYQKNFEIMNAFPAVNTVKELAKFCFFEYGNLKIASEIALFAGAARLASLTQSDVVLWGENPALTVGDHGALAENEFDGSTISNINTLKQVDLLPKKIIENHKYFYDLKDALEEIAPKLVFMGSIIPRWSNLYNGLYSLMNGFTRRGTSTDYLSLSAVDEDFVIINQYIKYLKYGFSRTTDIVNELIRLGDMERDRAIKIVNEFDGYVPNHEVKRFSSFISIEEKVVWDVIQSYVNRDLFTVVGKDVKPKFQVGLVND